MDFCRWQRDGIVSWCPMFDEQTKGGGGKSTKCPAALKYVLSKVKKKIGERRPGRKEGWKRVKEAKCERNR